MIEIKKDLSSVTTITENKYTKELVINNPRTLFIFGDNVAQVGKGGQACIRGISNTIGIPTKRFPSMKENSFFNDDDFECHEILIKAITKINHKFTDANYDEIVFSKNALGTGLAQMPRRCPMTFLILNTLLKTHFGIHITSDYYYTKA